MSRLSSSTLRFRFLRVERKDSGDAIAQDHTHMLMSQAEGASQRNQTSAFLELVRESTERFRDVSVAENEG